MLRHIQHELIIPQSYHVRRWNVVQQISWPAGGNAGGLVGIGNDALQFSNRDVLQFFVLDELGQRRSEKGIARAIGVAYLTGDAVYMACLSPEAIESAVGAAGHKN